MEKDTIKVLIIDDNVSLIQMVKEYFKDSSKIKVVLESYDGKDGIEVIDLNVFQNGKSIIDTYPYRTPEGKFLRASRIAYTPTEITVNISSEEKDKTNEQVKREILESIFSESDADYLADQYSASYDISKDKDYYIVNLRLK